MATRTGPNLAAAKRAVEKLMDDVLVITRNPLGDDDDAFNEETGVVTPKGDPIPVYDGKGMITVASSNVALPVKLEEGGGYYTQLSYNGMIPVDGAELKDGDMVTVTSSRRDPSLVGREFILHKDVASTFAIARDFQLEEKQKP